MTPVALNATDARYPARLRERLGAVLPNINNTNELDLRDFVIHPRVNFSEVSRTDHGRAQFFDRFAHY